MTAAAEVIQLRDDTERVFVHPWTPLITEAREHHGLRSSTDIAEWMCGQINWSALDHRSRVALLTYAVGRNPRGSKEQRRSVFGQLSQEGSSEAVMRMAVDPSVWDMEWAEVGYKETRQLTPADLEVLIMAYKTRAVRNLLRVKWFVAVQALAKKHKVQKLGQLEDRGIALPSESKVEAGE